MEVRNLTIFSYLPKIPQLREPLPRAPPPPSCNKVRAGPRGRGRPSFHVIPEGGLNDVCVMLDKQQGDRTWFIWQHSFFVYECAERAPQNVIVDIGLLEFGAHDI